MTNEPANEAEEIAIRRLIADRFRATRDKDSAAVIACQVAIPVHFSLAPPLLSVGSGDTALQAWFDTWEGPIGYELAELTVSAGSDVGFAYGLVRMTGTKKGGQKADLWFRQTFGFRKVAGAWKIAHEHQSTPFYMDGSFRAAVDLKP
ncbi:MAG TPA: nuclear transport factor 2 family protein [Aliidongia sp.]|uniref:YybH family protein n=1 Tax=Aliidongia sp. TaxID=1914230 RepID=UPI002DDD4C4B|nr:nuclear transport factor 2 family protein [Aliidongia sp.]HEV2678570.1 nuclear transport factor 2 family protein [Aliidongia sp.]